jgi:hypothetical protein
MELHALGRKFTVADPHHDSSSAGRLLELLGEVGVGDQRVVSARHQRAREPLVDALAVVRDLGVLAVDRLAADHLASERLDQRLVPEADPEHGGASLGEPLHRLDRHTRIGRCAGSRRYDEAIRGLVEQLIDGRAIVAHDLDLRPELAQVLDEVVGEGVVVVDHEDVHGHSGSAVASSTARKTAFALFTDSLYS